MARCGQSGPGSPGAGFCGTGALCRLFFRLGLGLIFGILLARNFDTPFRATSIGEFWQRWHMTLNQYLRDYVFTPLGELRWVGRRYRIVQHFAALQVTMTLCGLWHGYMFGGGQVVPKPQFASWIAQQQTQSAPATKNLPPYSKTYFPIPLRRGG